MWNFLRTILAGQNQFASGGLMLMIIGGISVLLRAVPEKLWEWLVTQTTMTVTVTDDDAAFSWVKEWFLDQKFLQKVRRVDLDTTLRNERIAMIPAPGRHWFWYGGKPFQVWFYRTENSNERVARRTETLTFRTLGRRREFLQSFVSDVVRSHLASVGVQSFLFTYNDGWDWVQGYAPRSLDSVIFEPGEKEHIMQDIERFRRSKQRYLHLGIPYHRGYLLHGPPGTGKTSIISALAAHFGLALYSMNLADFNDRTLLNAVNLVPANSVLLFEDIDCATSSKARPSASGSSDAGKQTGTAVNVVTLSGLLNVLDGFHAPTGVLFMMTTNRIEALDEALLRPGRIDYKLYLGKASYRQKVELYRRFFPQATDDQAWEFVESHRSAETMAEFQGRLLDFEQNRQSWKLVG